LPEKLVIDGVETLQGGKILRYEHQAETYAETRAELRCDVFCISLKKVL